MTTPASRSARLVEDIELLLSSGRTAMALSVLLQLPSAISVEIMNARAASYEEGRVDAAREILGARRYPTPTPEKRPPTRTQWLRELCADSALAERARAALRLDPDPFEQVLSNRAALSGEQWRRLRRELDG
jgi:hypothetical protein